MVVTKMYKVPISKAIFDEIQFQVYRVRIVLKMADISTVKKY